MLQCEKGAWNGPISRSSVLQVADMFMKHVEVAPLSSCASALSHAICTGTDSTQVPLMDFNVRWIQGACAG